jgi:acetyl esterase/lipase
VLNSVVADIGGAAGIARRNTPEETTVTVEGLSSLTKLYTSSDSHHAPYVAPILADFSGLPPMRIVYDKGELLAVDSKMVAEKARKAGVFVEVAEYSGCFHGFSTTGNDTPESKAELFVAAKFMQI